MDDIIPATRRMTYVELGKARGISAKSAERLAQRRRWPRQIGNDGFARVLVPLGEDHITPRYRGPDITPDVAERQPMSSPDIGDVIREAIREAVAPLSAQLEHERARADSERTRADSEQARAESEHVRAHSEQIRAESERKRADLEKMRADRAELREDSERTRAHSERIRAEALQAKLDDATAAERIAREEAAGLRAELDARRQWGLWRRVRGR